MKIKPLLPSITGLTFGLLSELFVREFFETVFGMAGPPPALWALLVGTLGVVVVGVVRRWSWVQRLVSLGTVLLGALLAFIFAFSQTTA